MANPDNVIIGCGKCKTATRHNYHDVQQLLDNSDWPGTITSTRVIYRCNICGTKRQYGGNRGNVADPGGLYLWPLRTWLIGERQLQARA